MFVKIKNEEKRLCDTWDNWTLRKLKQIGKSSLIDWSRAMGYENSGSMSNMVKRFIKEGKITKIRGLYEINKDIIFVDHYI